MSEHTMRAIRFHACGGPEQLFLERVPRPEPGTREVLVRVHAAGVNPIDWKPRQGYLREIMPLPLPYTPGAELIGTVEAAQALSQEGHGRGRIVLHIAG